MDCRCEYEKQGQEFQRRDKLHGNQYEPVLQIERNKPHGFVCFVSILQKPSNVPGFDRTVDDFESGGFLHRVNRHTRGTQLGEDQPFVIHDFIESGLIDPVNQFFRAECAFSCGAPDIDAFGIENENPAVQIAEFLPQPVEGHFIIGGDKYIRIRRGTAETIQPGSDLIMHAADSPPGFPGTDSVFPGKSG
jgi:hypothetical protein